jgi:hypothetical protein
MLNSVAANQSSVKKKKHRPQSQAGPRCPSRKECSRGRRQSASSIAPQQNPLGCLASCAKRDGEVRKRRGRGMFPEPPAPRPPRLQQRPWRRCRPCAHSLSICLVDMVAACVASECVGLRSPTIHLWVRVTSH